MTYAIVFVAGIIVGVAVLFLAINWAIVQVIKESLW